MDFFNFLKSQHYTYLHIFFCSISFALLTPSIAVVDAKLQQASFYQAPVFEMIPPLGN